MAPDPVNHPSHYNAGNIETIEYIEQVCANYQGQDAVAVGNVLKYLSRAPLKGKEDEDLLKAYWYFTRLLRRRGLIEGTPADKPECPEIKRRTFLEEEGNGLYAQWQRSLREKEEVEEDGFITSTA